MKLKFSVAHFIETMAILLAPETVVKFPFNSTKKLVLHVDSWVKFNELNNGVIDRGGKAVIQWAVIAKERCYWFYVLPRK